MIPGDGGRRGCPGAWPFLGPAVPLSHSCTQKHTWSHQCGHLTRSTWPRACIHVATQRPNMPCTCRGRAHTPTCAHMHPHHQPPCGITLGLTSSTPAGCQRLLYAPESCPSLLPAALRGRHASTPILQTWKLQHQSLVRDRRDRKWQRSPGQDHRCHSEPSRRAAPGLPSAPQQKLLPNRLPGCGGREKHPGQRCAGEALSSLSGARACSTSPFLAKDRPRLVQLQGLYTQ